MFQIILLAGIVLLMASVVFADTPTTQPQSIEVAGVTTTYFHNSHADVILSRLIQTDTLDGKGKVSPLKLVSLYTDQLGRGNQPDKSRDLAQQYGFSIYNTVTDTLTRGKGTLAVRGVLLVAEHGNYPHSPTGNTQYPKRRLFEEIAKVIEKSGQPVPVFCDKHLSDNWTDAKWIYDTAKRLKIPLMAGSSLPTLWREPQADVKRDAEVKEIFALSYHTLDHYGFHALEMVQCLVERRKGGETGIRAVQCLSDDAAWEAFDKNVFDKKLYEEALARQSRNGFNGKHPRETVPHPDLFIIEYADGLRAYVLTLNPAIGEWSVAWRNGDGSVQSTRFVTQEARPAMHFTFLLNGIEQMMITGQPAWPVERTLMTSGLLDALLQSKTQGGKRIETPYLMFSYKSDWNWKQPPPAPPGRPFTEQ